MRFAAQVLLIHLISFVRCAQHLVATAVVSGPDDVAEIECWEFSTPLHEYPTVGAAVALADVTNVTYVVLPPRSGEGLHKPPHPMLVLSACLFLPCKSNAQYVGGYSFFSPDWLTSRSPLEAKRHGLWKA